MKTERKIIKHEFEIGHISPSGEKYMLRGAFANKEKTRIYFGVLDVNKKSSLTLEIPIYYGRGHWIDDKTEAEMTEYYNDPENICDETLAQYLNQFLLVGLTKKYNS